MYCLLPLYALLTVATAQGVGTPTHTIILDVCNTSTQLKIFKDTVVHSRYGPDSSIKLIFSKAYPPGMYRGIDDPRWMLNHLDSILTEAKKQVLSAYFEWTHLYVMVTSDLRFLPVREMESILQINRDLLSSNKTLNPFQFSPSNVQLLSGEDEGAYTWLSANYILGAFGRNRYQNETVGVLDMGNGSTQITFVPDEPLYSEKYPLTYHHKKHELYTQNYLQYGAESIYVKIDNLLRNRSHGEIILANPCLLKAVKHIEVAKRQPAKFNGAVKCVDDVKIIQRSDGSRVMHRGLGDPDMCEDILMEIVKPHTGDECHPKPCAIGRVYQPRVRDLVFIATVGYVYTPTALGVVDETKILHLDRLKQAGRVYCKKTVQQVIAEYEKDKDSASQDCLMAMYIPTLLNVAYGFSMDTRQIRLVPDHEGEPIDWSHGVVVSLRV